MVEDENREVKEDRSEGEDTRPGDVPDIGLTLPQEAVIADLELCVVAEAEQCCLNTNSCHRVRTGVTRPLMFTTFTVHQIKRMVAQHVINGNMQLFAKSQNDTRGMDSSSTVEKYPQWE